MPQRHQPFHYQTNYQKYYQTMVDPLGHQQVVSYSLKIQKVLMSLLYGRILKMALSGETSNMAVFLADLVFYADYYDLLEAVRGHIVRWAKSLHHLLQNIREQPYFWVGFSRLLRSKDLYCHAMKHMVGHPESQLQRRWHRNQQSDSQEGEYVFPDDALEVAEVIEDNRKIHEANLMSQLREVINKFGPHNLYWVEEVDEIDELPEAAAGQSTRKIRQLVLGLFSS
jgi:hypothetical protein